MGRLNSRARATTIGQQRLAVKILVLALIDLPAIICQRETYMGVNLSLYHSSKLYLRRESWTKIWWY